MGIPLVSQFAGSLLAIGLDSPNALDTSSRRLTPFDSGIQQPILHGDKRNQINGSIVLTI